MLFKRKISVGDYCSGTLDALFSREREAVYEQLRQQCADPALNAVNQSLYFDHIRAIKIQLVLIAITKTYGLSARTIAISSDAGVCVMTYLRDHNLSRIDDLNAIYNRAFGADPRDGVAGMTNTFSQELTGGKLQSETVKRFYVEFYAILKSLFDDFKSIKLTSNR